MISWDTDRKWLAAAIGLGAGIVLLTVMLLTTALQDPLSPSNWHSLNEEMRQLLSGDGSGQGDSGGGAALENGGSDAVSRNGGGGAVSGSGNSVAVQGGHGGDTVEEKGGNEASGSGDSGAVQGGHGGDAVEKGGGNEASGSGSIGVMPSNGGSGTTAGVSGSSGGAVSETVSDGSHSGKLNLNTATVQQLVELPGIGESRANAILKLKEELGGRFTDVKQLLQVKGIGEKIFARLAPLVRVD